MANESQNDAITMSVQIYEQSLALYEKIWGLYNWLRISGALTIDPVTGVVTGSNITPESLEGANIVLNDYSILTVDGRTLTGVEAWAEVTAAILSMPALIPDSFAQFMHLASRYISH